MSSDTTIGITGARGFIGVKTDEYLRAQGVETKNFVGDLLDDRDIIQYFSKHRVEKIIHLVGAFELPFENQIKLNTMTTQKLLEVGIPRGLKKIIFASTGAVYGESPLRGSQETDELKPNTMYGLSKMWAEDCIQYYANNSNLKYTILRFPNVYGPGSTRGVIYNFLKSIKENGYVTVFGAGEQKRNFLFVDDAAEAIGKALSFEREDRVVFNISDEDLYSLNDLIQLLKDKKLNFTVRYESAETSNALQILSLNTDKAKTILGWQSKASLEYGIEKTLKMFSVLL